MSEYTSIMHISDIETTTAVTIYTSEGPIGLSVADVLRWIEPAAPPGEALKFLLTCKAAQVNPFLQEAYLIRMGDKWVTEISKAGWLHRAETHPQYNGFKAGIVIRVLENKVPTGDLIYREGACCPPGFVLVGGWAEVYRKDWTNPVRNEVSVIEYLGVGPLWKTKTSTMIRKVALVQSLREAGFLTSGTLDPSEVREHPPISVSVSRPGAPLPAAIDVEYENVPTASLSPDLAVEIHRLTVKAGMSDYQVTRMLSKRGVVNLVELTDVQGAEIIQKLREITDNESAGEIMFPGQDVPISEYTPEVPGDIPMESLAGQTLEDVLPPNERRSFIPDLARALFSEPSEEELRFARAAAALGSINAELPADIPDVSRKPASEPGESRLTRRKKSDKK